MQKALIALAIVLFAGVVYAQHPRHCVSPAEGEARVLQWDASQDFALRGHFYYDSNMERTAMREEIDNSTETDYFHTIHLHREHRSYYINLKTHVCTSAHLDRPFRRIEIPRDAHFVGDAIVGTNAFPNAGVLTTHWHHSNKSPAWEWYGVFTDGGVGCVPVLDHFHDSNIGTVETRFFDVVLGISDPDVFVPPSSCPRP
jgi:hypothetical protein